MLGHGRQSENSGALPGLARDHGDHRHLVDHLDAAAVGNQAAVNPARTLCDTMS